jgi:hypothetical protein
MVGFTKTYSGLSMAISSRNDAECRGRVALKLCVSKFQLSNIYKTLLTESPNTNVTASEHLPYISGQELVLTNYNVIVSGRGIFGH